MSPCHRLSSHRSFASGGLDASSTAQGRINGQHAVSTESLALPFLVPPSDAYVLDGDQGGAGDQLGWRNTVEYRSFGLPHLTSGA